MKSTDEIHESYLDTGVRFVDISQASRLRQAHMGITGMMWICNRAVISRTGDLEQGHSLILVWKN